MAQGEKIEKLTAEHANCGITDPASVTGEGGVNCLIMQPSPKASHRPDSMLLDRSEHQEQLESVKSDTCVGRKPKETNGQLRVPLQEKTNTREGTSEIQGDTPVTTKGQWKRKARLKGKADTDLVMTCLDHLQEPGKKRECMEVVSDQENLVDRVVGKKGRTEMLISVQQNSEVGDTSRNWSQSIR